MGANWEELLTRYKIKIPSRQFSIDRAYLISKKGI